MAFKVVVNLTGAHTREKAEKVQKLVADALGICCEDVVCLPDMTVMVVEVPDALTKAREKADTQEKHEAEKKAKEEAKAAEAKAAEEAKAHAGHAPQTGKK